MAGRGGQTADGRDGRERPTGAAGRRRAGGGRACGRASFMVLAGAEIPQPPTLTDMTHLSNFLTGAGGGGALMGQLNPTNSASRSRAVKNYIPQQGPGICLEKKCHVHSDFPTKVSTETCRHALQLHTSPPGLNSEGREMLFNLVDFFFREYHSFIEYA